MFADEALLRQPFLEDLDDLGLVNRLASVMVTFSLHEDGCVQLRQVILERTEF